MENNSIFLINLKFHRSVSARLISVYENNKLILKTNNLAKVNNLKISNESTLKIVVEPEIVGIRLVIVSLLELLGSGIGKKIFQFFL